MYILYTQYTFRYRNRLVLRLKRKVTFGPISTTKIVTCGLDLIQYEDCADVDINKK